MLTDTQLSTAEAPLDRSLFLYGPAMTGKTTAGTERILYLLENGVPGDSILVLVPQRTLAEPYRQALQRPDRPSSSQVTILTIGGLAKRTLELYWPLIAAETGLASPDLPPRYLTMETAQYYMATIVRPLIEQEGFFESVTMRRNRIYSQILDNLNKAAVVGFPHTEIGERLQEAWLGDPGQARIYADVQECATRFRTFCLEHNLLDFSLQTELFRDFIWPHPVCRDSLTGRFHHLIADNIEEDVPLTHDVLRAWLPDLDSALLIYDQGAGYRRFLGADPVSGFALRESCAQQIRASRPMVAAPEIRSLKTNLNEALQNLPLTVPHPEAPSRQAFTIHSLQYYPEMLTWVADQVQELIEAEHTPPGEIVILAPFLSDALRFSLRERFQERGIPSRSHRPSRALREEPATNCLLTLAAIAHPQWQIPPSSHDVTCALLQTLKGIDLLRARLLTQITYRTKNGQPRLTDFDQIQPETQERITYQIGLTYQKLKDWIYAYTQNDPIPLDHFLSRLFGEVLSQPEFGFHDSLDQGEVTANLIESIQKFRWAVGETFQNHDFSLGQEYLHMVQDGVIAAQYVKRWTSPPDDAVFMAPAYTFLMNNRPVDVQFWLDVGSQSWYERIFQPLTHPYVLSRNWERGDSWTDTDEWQVTQSRLQHLVGGLLSRCRRQIFLGVTQLNEQGYEQKGKLLQAVNRILRHHRETHPS
jgi:hypothetical protein